MGTKAAIYIHPDGNEDKQQRAVVDHCDRQGYDIASIANTPEAVAQAIADGHAEVVVAATDPRNGLRNLIAVAGGRTEFVRERSRAPTLRDFLNRAVQRGRTNHQIAEGIGSETTDITELLKRLGLRKPDDRP